MLRQSEIFPERLLDADPADLESLLGTPTLVHLPGRRPSPLFVSVLLHGNEDTGLRALQRLLRKYQQVELPRALSIFFGNVSAAKLGQRRLDGQPDYNRVWPGGTGPDSPESRMMRDVVDVMRSRGVFASIDVHNNTGLNPHYACVNSLDDRFLHLAVLFSRTVVYFTEPRGVQSLAFAPLCPSTTIECGKPGSEGSDTHAADFIEATLHLSGFPQQGVNAHDIDLYHTVATVKIPEETEFSFDGTPADVMFEPDMDRLNFRELATGSRFAAVRAGCTTPLRITSGDGQNSWADFFQIQDGELTVRRPVMPSMLTLDRQIVRQDCLCYLMERLNPETRT